MTRAHIRFIFFPNLISVFHCSGCNVVLLTVSIICWIKQWWSCDFRFINMDFDKCFVKELLYLFGVRMTLILGMNIFFSTSVSTYDICGFINVSQLLPGFSHNSRLVPIVCRSFCDSRMSFPKDEFQHELRYVFLHVHYIEHVPNEHIMYTTFRGKHYFTMFFQKNAVFAHIHAQGYIVAWFTVRVPIPCRHILLVPVCCTALLKPSILSTLPILLLVFFPSMSCCPPL